VQTGQFEQAPAALEKALAISQEADIELLYPFAAAPLGGAYASLGRTDEALALLESAIEKSVAMNRMVDAALLRYWQGQALMLADDIPAALKAIDRGVALSITYKERGNQAALLRLLGDIHLHLETDELSKAFNIYGEACEIADQLNMRPVLSRCHLGLARLHEKKKETELATSHRNQAASLCEEIGVDYWMR